MARKLFCEISPLTYCISTHKEILKRCIRDLLRRPRFARHKSTETLPVTVYSHRSLIRRRLGNVDMTLQVLHQFGIGILEKDSGFLIPGGQRYTAPQEKPIPEGDWSGAAFWYGVNACGGSIKVNGLNGHSAQGDSVVASLAQTLPDVIDTGNIPDLVPVLSIMACK